MVQLFDYVTEEHAKLQIENLRRDRRSTYEEDVAGIGDDGLWSTSTVTLLVRKGQFVVNICLEIKDVPHDNLVHAKDVAALALHSNWPLNAGWIIFSSAEVWWSIRC